jgi:hypothetical protein
MHIKLIDDGTLDTVVRYRGHDYRYSTEYRRSFESDSHFLSEVQEELDALPSDAWMLDQ